MKSLRFLPLLAVLAAIGCQAPTLPNPNDPQDVGNLSPENLDGQMKQIDEHMAARQAKGEITDAQRQAIDRQAAFDLTRGFNPSRIDPLKAYVYGEYLITAEKWSLAKTVLKAAVEQAKASRNEDRRVNDSLSLAQAEAALGEVDEAIKTTRTTFNVELQGAVPILYAVEGKIVPAGRGKGKDLELAKLLSDAIEIDRHAKVDLSRAPGIDYVNSRFVKVPQAWNEVIDLYTAAHRTDLADKAKKDRDASLAELRSDTMRNNHDFFFQRNSEHTGQAHI